MGRRERLETPDGRYFVSRGRLWRKSDPGLSDSERRAGIKSLMQARRAGQLATSPEDMQSARAAVEDAKLRLGERGPVWWDDGAPDESGLHPAASSYAGWWALLSDQVRGQAEES